LELLGHVKVAGLSREWDERGIGHCGRPFRRQSSRRQSSKKFCAVAAMHWTAALHLPDPLASLHAFLTAAFIGRVVLELILLAALSKADRVRG
jgi:hypothetical protein